MADKPQIVPPPKAPDPNGPPVEPDEPVVYRTVVGLGSSILTVDTIKVGGHFWLVPTWLEHPTENWKMPERIVLLDWLQHQPMGGSKTVGQAQFLVNEPVPKSLFDDARPSSKDPRHVVHLQPNIRMRKNYLPGLHYPSDQSFRL